MKLAYGFAAAATLAFATLLPQAAMADRVCNERCSGGVCKQECIETDTRVDRREERREERYEERREPGVDIRVPGVGIEIGR